MPKVLYIIDTLQTGGAEKSLLAIASRLTAFEPVFIQLFKGDQLVPLFREKSIPVVQLNLSPSYKFTSIAKQLVPIIEEISPVIIHTTLFRSDLVGRNLKKILNIPLVNSLVNNSYGKERYGRMGMVLKAKLMAIQLWDRYTAGKVDLFVSNSETIKFTNSRALGIDAARIKVIYRGRLRYEFDNVSEFENTKIRSDLNVGDRKVFLNISRLLDRKGQLDLISAFDSLYQHEKDIVLLIAGEGPLKGDLESMIKERKLDGVVKLLGNRNDRPVLLSMADCFVFPSYFEGLPGVLIEAMFSKTLIIASDIPENQECVDRSSALLFRKGDVADLAARMSEALTLQNSTELVENAYKAACVKFDLDEITRNYESTYQKILNQSI